MSRNATTPEFFQASQRSKMAMLVAYVSWSMLFATLFLGYTIYRFSATSWPPNGFERISLIWPGISTLIIALSSLSFVWTRKSYVSEDRKSFVWGLILTTIFAFGFLGAQFILWNKLSLMGLFASAGVFPSIIHAFTWIHAGHIACAILAMFYLFFFIKKESFLKNKIITVKNIENFWHFLGVVWLIMFVFLFVV